MQLRKDLHLQLPAIFRHPAVCLQKESIMAFAQGIREDLFDTSLDEKVQNQILVRGKIRLPQAFGGCQQIVPRSRSGR